MIRASSHQLNESNKEKRNFLCQIFHDFEKDLNFYIDLIILNVLPLQKLSLSSKVLPIGIIKHSQWRQILYKTASEILRNQKQKAEKQRHKHLKRVYAKCAKDKRRVSFLSKRFSELYLKPILQSKFFTKPSLKNISIMLDERLFDLQKGHHFDEFVRIKSPYFHEGKKRAICINLPIKHHRHSKKFNTWSRKKSMMVKLNRKIPVVKFFYERENLPKKENVEILGMDCGYKKLLSDSNGNHYGKELFGIYQRLANKVRGSRNYRQFLNFKKTEINKVLNKISSLDKISTLFLEDLKSVKYKSKIHSKIMNKMQYWSYAQVMSKLEMLSQEKGFLIVKVDPAYTSQTCSHCGCVDEKSRNGECFYCQHCKIELDADTNAAKNILHRGV